MEGTAKNHRTLTLKRLSKGVSYTADIDWWHFSLSIFPKNAFKLI